jgi:hypothetical protein
MPQATLDPRSYRPDVIRASAFLGSERQLCRPYPFEAYAALSAIGAAPRQRAGRLLHRCTDRHLSDRSYGEYSMAVPHPDIDFRSMNRRTRTVALVGYYLQRWARMEIEIDSAISTALRLNGTQKYIIIPNIAFHHKIQLLGP